VGRERYRSLSDQRPLAVAGDKLNLGHIDMALQCRPWPTLTAILRANTEGPVSIEISPVISTVVWCCGRVCHTDDEVMVRDIRRSRRGDSRAILVVAPVAGGAWCANRGDCPYSRQSWKMMLGASRCDLIDAPIPSEISPVMTNQKLPWQTGNRYQFVFFATPGRILHLGGNNHRFAR
jgi:hypothetical protein